MTSPLSSTASPQSQASLTAKSTAVIWRLHRSKLSHADTPGSRAAHAQTRAQHVPSTEACRRVEQMTEEMQETGR